MDFPYNEEKSSAREDFIQAWYQQEKIAERIGAVLLLFAAVLILVLEKPSPAEAEYRTFVLAAAVGCFAGGVTLLLRSRRPSAERRALIFLRSENLSRTANFASIGAALLFWQGNGKAMLMIVAVLLFIFSLWLQWRVLKIRQFEALFAPPVEETHE